MSKIRIYELARELGLDNKVLLDLCTQLGFDGKSSHSNSLSDDEAEKIRRSVIRRAVSGKEGLIRDIEKENGTVSEQRFGNVIRRRKKTAEESTELENENKKHIDLSDVPRSSLDLDKHAPDLNAEKRRRSDALREADSIFAQPTAEGIVESVPSTDNSVVKQDVDLPSELLNNSEVTPPSAEPPLQENQKSISGEEDFNDQLETGPPGEEVAFQQETHERLETFRRRHDIRAPKVLGKIDLPVIVPDAKKSIEAKTSGSENGTAEKAASRLIKPAKRKAVMAGDDESDDRPSRLRRRKQVLKKDELLDYGSDREIWRKQRDKKLKKKEFEDEREKGEGVVPEIILAGASKRTVRIAGEISVGELAKIMGIKLSDVMLQLMNLGIMATVNHLIDFETANLIASEFGFATVNTGQDQIDIMAELNEADNPDDLKIRPPVVTVMGHVDHGKTSLLDAIRKSRVTEAEVGGITQHIGAYNVSTLSGGSVTFLDTPGHAAFTSMRSRGAKVTDIVVLVVAADDGIMPQTIEAINHAKSAGAPIIVAVNKIDKEGANIERVKKQLTEYELVTEEWGGTTIVVPVSAHTKEGIDLLLENLYLQAEILELKANPNRKAVGTVIESKLDRGRGPVITILVQNGTLRIGDSFVCGAVAGKVRALNADTNKSIKEAGPSIPVEVIGASGTPLAGDDFLVVNSDTDARNIADTRSAIKRKKELALKAGIVGAAPLTLANFSDMVTSITLKELPVIIKADVQGSVEAVAGAIEQISNEEVKVKVVHKGVGAISENDVHLALASGAIVLAFTVRSDSRAAALIEAEGINVIYSRVIYELIDSVTSLMKGMLSPKFKEMTLGRVEVRETFRVPKLGVVAGSYVIDGTIQRGANVRLVRDSKVVFEGKMASLRRFKDDVREVAAGYECGIGIEGFNDIKSGDIIEVYKIQEVQR